MHAVRATRYTCNYASVGEIAGIANSVYQALETSVRKRFGHGLSFLASYTLSKSIDDVSSFNITGSASQPVAGENDLAQNPFDLAAERGRSMFDSRHRLVLSYQWSLPFWRQATHLVSACPGQLAAQRHRDAPEWHALHRLRFDRRFVARPGARDFRILQQSSGPDWQPEQRTAYIAGMVQHEGVPAVGSRSEFAGTTVRKRGTQCGARSGLCRIGTSRP